VVSGGKTDEISTRLDRKLGFNVSDFKYKFVLFLKRNFNALK
jgi:hypothetical protein